MEQSPTLTASLMELYDVFSTGDGDKMAQLTTSHPGLVFIGTDPDEWLTSLAEVRGLAEAQAGVGVKVRHGDMTAYEEGTVGWVADQGAFLLPDGGEVPFRMTAVFHREDGVWKLVQEHASVAVTNEDALGTEI